MVSIIAGGGQEIRLGRHNDGTRTSGREPVESPGAARERRRPGSQSRCIGHRSKKKKGNGFSKWHCGESRFRFDQSLTAGMKWRLGRRATLAPPTRKTRWLNWGKRPQFNHRGSSSGRLSPCLSENFLGGQALFALVDAATVEALVDALAAEQRVLAVDVALPRLGVDAP